MKKIIVSLWIIVLTITGCQSNIERNGEKLIETVNCNNQEQTILVKNNPKRLAVMDYSALDIIDTLNLGGNVVGVSKQENSIEYLNSYIENDNLINLGTIKEPNMEGVLEANPDLIIIGGRLAEYYDELSKIAPVYLMQTKIEEGVVNSIKNNAKTIASLYGIESEVEKKFVDYEKRIKEIKEFSKEKTAIISIISGQKFSVLGDNGRCSLISNEFGFKNIGLVEGQETSTHGNEVSYEFILETNPEYIFVLDRDQAIGTQSGADEIFSNEIIKETTASKNNNIIILENSNIWYMADGGIKALDIMISDIEKSIS